VIVVLAVPYSQGIPV